MDRRREFCNCFLGPCLLLQSRPFGSACSFWSYGGLILGAKCLLCSELFAPKMFPNVIVDFIIIICIMQVPTLFGHRG